ncbi:MAG: hypothetical protein A2Z21_07570 [Candidatus Fraserbacteria bacterium RBG_16_55_9]|uniref:SpoVT-AbrB domain-containing protein n=1 Tax=Fraserbacteria sp. (strain RBG_16_55_9) TaxID=1817864 RepID=A0A1F5UQX1_FRAXR|nr:MAG: hypothetical protein A2Z21_07570 [Candidatus Fraserbacteria bacterium RBG_16_55_9]
MKGRQVVIPKELFEELDLKEGDYLEARVKRGQLVYAPKKLIDRDIAEALQDIEEGRVYGPFDSVQEWLESLKKKS